MSCFDFDIFSRPCIPVYLLIFSPYHSSLCPCVKIVIDLRSILVLFAQNKAILIFTQVLLFSASSQEARKLFITCFLFTHLHYSLRNLCLLVLNGHVMYTRNVMLCRMYFAALVLLYFVSSFVSISACYEGTNPPHNRLWSKFFYSPFIFLVSIYFKCFFTIAFIITFKISVFVWMLTSYSSLHGVSWLVIFCLCGQLKMNINCTIKFQMF